MAQYPFAGGASGRDNAIESGVGVFLGSAISKYDVDELDDLGKRRKQMPFVEVRRPDGTVAKARGERTFYGAFTGGFSAGYWGTVGSKEGFTPGEFVSSRAKRDKNSQQRAEDFMDEEDLREHRSTHSTITPRGDFAVRGAVQEQSGSAIPGGLPLGLEQAIFQTKEKSLGARMLDAGSAALPGAERPTAPGKARKTYGCARPPAGFTAGASDPELAGEIAAGRSVSPSVVPGLGRKLNNTCSSSKQRFADQCTEADLERLWRPKTDLHGVGYGAVGTISRVEVPTQNRLYMSSKRAQGSSKGYGDFGTGVLDQDEQDGWEDLYDHDRSHAGYDFVMEDEEEKQASLNASLHDSRSSVHSREASVGSVPGFVEARETDDAGSPDLSALYLPAVPRGYRGKHTHAGPASAEARSGSAEHQQLLEFLEKHGAQHLLDPARRAEMLGERGRATKSEPSKPLPTASASSATPVAASAQPPAAGGALWAGVSDEAKKVVLEKLGRNFVAGSDQDMGGGAAARNEPFKSDPQKQKRYVRFCMALEGKFSASDVLRDSGNLSEAEHAAEIADFGRVYKLFKLENPNVDIEEAMAQDSKEKSMAPVLRRRVLPWQPDKLLCKRLGVPEPKVAPGDLSSSNQQSKYQQQVQAGLASIVATALPKAGAAPDTIPAVGFSPVPLLQGKAEGELVRPPKSLFASIFGDGGSDDET